MNSLRPHLKESQREQAVIVRGGIDRWLNGLRIYVKIGRFRVWSPLSNQQNVNQKRIKRKEVKTFEEKIETELEVKFKGNGPSLTGRKALGAEIETSRRTDQATTASFAFIHSLCNLYLLLEAFRSPALNCSKKFEKRLIGLHPSLITVRPWVRFVLKQLKWDDIRLPLTKQINKAHFTRSRVHHGLMDASASTIQWLWVPILSEHFI